MLPFQRKQILEARWECQFLTPSKRNVDYIECKDCDWLWVIRRVGISATQNNWDFEKLGQTSIRVLRSIDKWRVIIICGWQNASECRISYFRVVVYLRPARCHFLPHSALWCLVQAFFVFAKGSNAKKLFDQRKKQKRIAKWFGNVEKQNEHREHIKCIWLSVLVMGTHVAFMYELQLHGMLISRTKRRERKKR